MDSCAIKLKNEIVIKQFLYELKHEVFQMFGGSQAFQKAVKIYFSHTYLECSCL
jgi:hypothetical protein